MDIAIVTGAATGIGLAISRRLVNIGMRVYGLGGSYGQTNYSHEYFVPTPCDLANPEDITEKVEAILKKEGHIFALVNNAKVYPSTAFLDKISLAELEKVLRVNLLCPLILTRLALPSLAKFQGFIVNIAPSTADLAKGGPAGAASAGGLRWMGKSLFEECRDFGVKVTSIFPQTNVVDRAALRRAPEKSHQPQSAIDIEAVAEAVESIINNPRGNIITEMVIRPQRLSEKPIPPPLIIPIPPGEQIHIPVHQATAADMAKTRAAIRKSTEKKARKPRAPRKTPARKPREEPPPRKKSAKPAPRRPSRKPRPETASVTKKTARKPKPTKPAAKKSIPPRPAKKKIASRKPAATKPRTTTPSPPAKKTPAPPAKKSMRNRSRTPKKSIY